MSDDNQSKMDLVFFEDAILHISRVVRVLLQPRGNSMLIGVSGCGKQSLTRLASFMLGYTPYQIQLSKSYSGKDFRTDIKTQMMKCGCTGEQVTFLMTDTQIINENFLEDVNNVLNTGEITNLYEEEDMNTILEEITPYAKSLGRIEQKDILYATYIERVRDLFHIILCMSPVGDSLRIRCRMFPSLVNCCTLDWYDSWSEAALLNVSKKFINEIEEISDENKDKLAQMCMYTHLSVEKMTT